MTKIVINSEFGGFSLSQAAKDFYKKCGGKHDFSDYFTEISRDDPALVYTVEILGPDANGCAASLKVVDIPKGTIYRIKEYDGKETIEKMCSLNDWKVA